MGRNLNAKQWLMSLISKAYAITIILSLVICAFSFVVPKWARMEFTKDNLPLVILLPLGLFFILGAYMSVRIVFKETMKKFDLFFLVLIPLSFVFQVYCVWNYYFITDWDVGCVFTSASLLAHGEDLSPSLMVYNSRFPNNAFMVFIFKDIISIVNKFGLNQNEYEYFSLIVFCSLINTLSGCMTYNSIAKITGNRVVAVLGYLLYCILVGISPWVSIPYSDSLGLLFPILIVTIYVYRDSFYKIEFAWFLLALCSIIGYKIKPQVVFVFLAVLVVELLSSNRLFSFNNVRSFISMLIGVVLALTIVGSAEKSLNITVDPNKEFTATNILMMGLNEDSMGVWASEDVEYSASFETVNERSQGELRCITTRIKDMGPLGAMRLLVQKTLSNYNDGTFCWGGEGLFYSKVYESNGSLISSITRSLYYNRSQSEAGVNYSFWKNSVTSIWFSCLFVGVFSVFRCRKKELIVMHLSVVALSLFELVFECRARYLYAFVPVYISIASCGIEYIMNIIFNRLNRGFVGQ